MNEQIRAILSTEQEDALLWHINSLGQIPEYLVITGSHSWSLSTPESDIDIRGVYGQPLRQALSLYLGRDNIQGTKKGGIDYQIYEVSKALKMLCRANGNLVEMFLNPLVVYCTEWGERLRALAALCLTQRLSGYYLGYATSQRKRAMQNRGGKALIYTYREIFAGIYLMAFGKVIFDFEKLRSKIEETWFHSDVLPWALAHRTTPTPSNIMGRFEHEWQELQKILVDERETSTLPEYEPIDFEQCCDDLLWDYRMKGIA